MPRKKSPSSSKSSSLCATSKRGTPVIDAIGSRVKKIKTGLSAKESSATDSVAGLLSNVNLERKEIEGVASRYVDGFGKNGSEEAREENYQEVVNDYYNLVTDFYEYGWGTSFHFCTQKKGESYRAALARHEHFLALKLKIGPGKVALDCGCGVGGPAREIAHFSGANVVGVTINEYQVQRAVSHTQKMGLSDQCMFVQGNFMELSKQFKNNSFDAAYAIEATCHAPDRVACYKQIFDCLKPGGTFATYEWCMTDNYDENDEQHRSIKLGIEEGDGIPNLVKPGVCIDALEEVGFNVTEHYDLVDETDIEWYEPLDAKFTLSNFRQTKVGRAFTHAFVNFGEFFGLMPKGTVKTHDFLIKAADNLVLGGKKRLFTPMYLIVVQKPN